MLLRLMTTLLTLSIVASLVPSVEAKTRHRKHAVAPPPAAGLWYTPSHQEPARMIEVRPGLWVSSYGCITDEGYGRIAPCDVSEGKR